MNQQFQRILINALRVTNYSGEKDNNKFRAAVQDLLRDDERSRKFILNNADDRFLEICDMARTGAASADVVRSRACQYLWDQYRIDQDFTEEMVEAVVTAFALYGGRKGPVKSRTVVEHRDASESPQSPAVQPVQPEIITEPKERGNGWRLFLILAAVAVCIGIIVGIFSCNTPSEDPETSQDVTEESVPAKAEVTPSDIKILAYDVNYSQCWKHSKTFSKSGVEVLFLVRNESDSAINRFDFSLETKKNGMVTNKKNPYTPFHAVGYLGPGKKGYMYARIHIPNNTAHSQGKIKPLEVYACETRPDSPKVKVSKVDWYNKTYKELTYNTYTSSKKRYKMKEWNFDCTLSNTTDETVHKKDIILIAAPNLNSKSKVVKGKVFGRWAYGKIKKEIPAGESIRVKQGLIKPEFDRKEIKGLKTKYLKVYVIEK